ncbi:MAG: tRNA (adenosine(37)-N6)-threonylcarbamoyltransferase complex dimerization subunit type 1 TsaB [Actinomycetota bacterium]|nr:tRNA (adenosine(37)-N6)-threonylcarbamoyltransferase complex dimerization subunit type 1 TsaB [Actinomycetota bacterium]
MIVLGFDTATPATAVGVRLPDGRTLCARDDPRAGEHPGHATRLLGMAAELLAQAGISWRELERIAVGVGPGRFTGLRVGIATARGLAQSLSLEIVGVSTLQTLAEAALCNRAEAEAGDGVLAVIDARRGEAFAAAYAPAPGGSVAELKLPHALAPAQLQALAAKVFGGDQGAQEGRARRWLAVGDGAIQFREHLRAAGATVPADSSPLHLLDAAVICDLGARATAAVSSQEIVPDYRRDPDAQLARERGGIPAGIPVLEGAGG